MQTIAIKLSSVRAAAPGWSDADIRSLIHGVGGSPRRAKRLLRSNPESAMALAAAYHSDVTGGVPHVKAVQAANLRWAELSAEAESSSEEFAGESFDDVEVPADMAATPEGDPDEHDDDDDAEAEAAALAKLAAAGQVIRRRRSH